MKEYNLVRKDHRKVDLKFALCYPSTYAVGMSSLGFRLIYALLNSRDDVACERFFYTFEGEPRSVESGLRLSEFDVIGFSLQYEEDYVNMVRMLIDSKIPVRRSERSEDDPLIVAGGVCATENPMPLSDFVDVFVVGDGEILADKLADICIEERDREACIEALSNMEGIYTPAFNDGEKVRRVWCKSIENVFYPIRQVVPAGGERLAPVFGRTFLLEVARGCERGCRFCLIGFIGRPRRTRSKEVLRKLMDEGVKQSGVQKITFIASSMAGLDIVDLCWEAVNAGFEISLPSLSIDTITDELLEALMKGGQRTITIAPEAGTESMRRRINKPFSDDEVISTAERILERGFNLKAYFMIGLPYESDEDVEAIAKITGKMVRKGMRGKLKIDLNPFVPKPHTPFSWAPMNTLPTLRNKKEKVRKQAKIGGVVIEGEDPRRALIEAILSLGGKEVGQVIELAAIYGGGLGAWRRALKESRVRIDYVHELKDPDKEYPWEIIDVGVNKSFLVKEWERAKEEVWTPPYSHCKECMVCNC
ncbi:MAG: radical SAM protein [Candidatus Jordarchaeales archaeon]